LLLIFCLAASCGNKQVATQPTASDPLRTIAVQIDRAAAGLDAAIDIKRALLKDNLITREQSAALTPKILTAIRLVRELKDTLATVNDFQTGRPKLVDVFARVQSGFATLTDLGIVPAGQARDKIANALNIAVTALAALKPLIGGA
jgi:hypothetical protein